MEDISLIEKYLMSVVFESQHQELGYIVGYRRLFGHLKQSSNGHDNFMPFSGFLKDRVISGSLYAARTGNSSELSRKAMKFRYEINNDDKFGIANKACTDSKYWLKYSDRGNKVYQFLGGWFSNDALIVFLIYAAENTEFNKICHSSGVFIPSNSYYCPTRTSGGI